MSRLLTVMSLLMACPPVADPRAGDIFVGEYLYVCSDGLSLLATFTLARDGTFLYKTGSDSGYGAEFAGTYTFDGKQITLTPTRITPPGVEMKFTRFIPVRYGTRRYLVRHDEMKRFCDDVNLGLEPCRYARGHHFLGRDDHRLPVDGLPGVPDPWGEALLPEPVSATVMRVEDGTGTIDAGSREGLRVGMLLFLRDEDPGRFEHLDAMKRYGGSLKHLGLIEVVDTAPDSATVRVPGSRFFVGMREGQSVSSRLPDGVDLDVQWFDSLLARQPNEWVVGWQASGDRG